MNCKLFHGMHCKLRAVSNSDESLVRTASLLDSSWFNDLWPVSEWSSVIPISDLRGEQFRTAQDLLLEVRLLPRLARE